MAHENGSFNNLQTTVYTAEIVMFIVKLKHDPIQ